MSPSTLARSDGARPTHLPSAPGPTRETMAFEPAVREAIAPAGAPPLGPSPARAPSAASMASATIAPPAPAPVPAPVPPTLDAPPASPPLDPSMPAAGMPPAAPRTGRAPHRRRAAWALGTVLLGLGLAAALRPTPVEVESATAVVAPMQVTVDAEGRTQVRDRYVVAAPVTGRLERLLVVEGAPVRAGAVVARLAPLPLDATTAGQAEARLDAAIAGERAAVALARDAAALAAKAARDLERARRLTDAGAMAPAEREAAELASRGRHEALAATRARARAAAADVAGARAALLALGAARTPGGAATVPVRAPADGRVLRVPERSERVVAAGTPLLEVGDARALEIVADVLSRDAVRVRPGQRVLVESWGGDRPLEARVRLVEPAAFTRVSALGVEEQRVNVRMDLVRAPPTLGDGYRVDTRTVVWEAPRVLTVPASAVVQGAGARDAAAVFVVDDGRARRRAVRLGHWGAASVEIVSGLRAGDRVVLFPGDAVTDGVRVRTR